MHFSSLTEMHLLLQFKLLCFLLLLSFFLLKQKFNISSSHHKSYSFVFNRIQSLNQSIDFLFAISCQRFERLQLIHDQLFVLRLLDNFLFGFEWQILLKFFRNQQRVKNSRFSLDDFILRVNICWNVYLFLLSKLPRRFHQSNAVNSNNWLVG